MLQGELPTYRMESLGRDLEGEDSAQPLSEMFMAMVLQKRVTTEAGLRLRAVVLGRREEVQSDTVKAVEMGIL